MSELSDDREASALGQARLGDATAQLRSRRNPRAVEVANDVLVAALRSSRRSLPIRAGARHHHVFVSDQVLISRLRRAIDDGVPRCSVGRVYLRVDPDATLRVLTIELYVQYGVVLMEVADQVREIAGASLAQTLGTSGGNEIRIVLTHIHVSDVTVGDPHLVDPADEAT